MAKAPTLVRIPIEVAIAARLLRPLGTVVVSFGTIGPNLFLHPRNV
jgi:hypothetical protein